MCVHVSVHVCACACDVCVHVRVHACACKQRERRKMKHDEGLMFR